MSSPSRRQRVGSAPLTRRQGAAVAILLVLLTGIGLAVVRAVEAQQGTDAEAIGRTPPRVSFIDGQVSFSRPGAEGWMAAQLNTPLAPGDEIYTASPGNLEVEIGGRAYVRAWANTHLGLANLEPDFVQLNVTTGSVALDIRRLDPGHTIEVDTPNAAFTIERAGYYRVNVIASRTSFVTRRGGRATVTPANGPAAALNPSEEVIVEGPDGGQVATYVAPQLDAWDRWNYARTDALIESVSARYVSPGTYGVHDLDYHGSWRVVETHGPVWVPTGVPAGWAPYTTGSWIWDPHYGWTWVDTAPWGWAPYHYGRWVFVSGLWAWAPGTVVVRAVYAPALVAFFGPRVGVTVAVGGPPVGWVALGWGEPLVPWWGRAGFIGVPWWAGWGGPRIVNNVVIQRTTVVRVEEIKVYRNVTVRDAVVVVPRDHFGQGPVTRARITQVDPSHFAPVHGKLEITPVRASLAPDVVRGARPPDAVLKRAVVGTRAPEDPGRWLGPHGITEKSTGATLPPRLVPRPEHRDDAGTPSRPPFGESKIERPRPAQPPRPAPAQPPSGQGAREPRMSRPEPAPAQPGPPPRPSAPARPSRPAPQATGVEPRPAPTPGVEARPGAPAPLGRPDSAPPRGESRPAPPRGGGSAPVQGPAPGLQKAPAMPTGAQVQTPDQRGPSGRDVRRGDERKLPGEPANRLFQGQ
jgi:hypothetical protein